MNFMFVFQMCGKLNMLYIGLMVVKKFNKS